MDQDSTKTLRLAAGLTVLLALALAAMGLKAAVAPAAVEPSGAGAWVGASLSVAVLLSAIWTFLKAKSAAAASPEPFRETVPAPALQPAPPPHPAAPAAEPGAEALMLLSLLQEKGRFVDFVMEDIAAYSNEQVGAAARVVHQGCRAVVQDAFSPLPVAPAENARITLEPGYDAGEFRLVGRAEGGMPMTVKVTHKGWRARHVKLPRATAAAKVPESPVIVPAEVAA